MEAFSLYYRHHPRQSLGGRGAFDALSVKRQALAGITTLVLTGGRIGYPACLSAGDEGGF